MLNVTRGLCVLKFVLVSLLGFLGYDGSRFEVVVHHGGAFDKFYHIDIMRKR
jgi:hypothetical protein